MSQGRILEVLASNPEKWFTAKEICKITGQSKAITPLRKLRECNDIQYREISVRDLQGHGRMRFEYKHKED